ncbi:fumarate hydratase [Mesotoga sp. SC_3PWM13N19]|uniref:FumA C-terminus/TtdB family hydratase beta subunit n=1 Tax=unclassified Mesotoga TaxID=1184398 RepID=UPI000DBFB5D3|nr:MULTISPECIES: FumA C-terminus/TtdB family hydratase beta subunit [unclassified Mesotoga]RAM57929.1 fumarate hydratase [Mesotoga sp. SC_3PWM13N19]
MRIEELRVGDELDYSGEFLVMRDAAQKRLSMMIEKNEELPVNLDKRIVFYAGPAKSVNGLFGAIGPTTSSRMDSFLEMLYLKGVLATVGKGKRSRIAASICKNYGRVYFLAPSGAAAALAGTILSMKVLAFEDLGTEAIFSTQVKNFPLYVAIDSLGNDVFDTHVK